MPDLQTVIQTFQEQLQAIPMPASTSEASSPKMSSPLTKKRLVNYELLSAAVLPPPNMAETIASREETEAYSAGLLDKAIYIGQKTRELIDVLTKDPTDTITTTYLAKHPSIGVNVNKLSVALAAIDLDTWLPKIIDERTHDIGLALQSFLQGLLDETTPLPHLDLFVLTKKVSCDSETIKTSIQATIDTLKQRLDKYKTYNIDKIKTDVERLATMAELRATSDEQHNVLTLQCDHISDYLESLQTTTPPMDDQALAKAIDTLTTYVTALNAAYTQFVTFQNEWTDQASQYFKASDCLAFEYHASYDESEAKIRADDAEEDNGALFWTSLTQLFNDDNIKDKLINETLLEQAQQGGVLLFQTNQLIETLTLKREHLEQFKAFRLALQQDLPTYDPLLPIHTDTPPPENNQIEKESASAFYVRKALELKTYRDQLLMQKEQFYQTCDRFLATHPFPTTLEETDVNMFTHAREAIETSLLSQQAELARHINTVNASLEHTELEQERLARELIVLNKELALKQGEGRVRGAFKETESSKIKWNKTQTEYEAFKKRYAQQAHGIEEHYIPLLNQLESDIEQMRTDIAASNRACFHLKYDERDRRAFLFNASTQLMQFKTILLEQIEQKGFYMPQDKIPKAELIHSLEYAMNAPEIEQIDSMYQQAEEANKRYGVNWRHAKDSWSYFTGTGKISFEEEARSILQNIDEKLALIQMELSVSLDGEDACPTSRFLPENNLWSVQKKTHDHEQHITATKALLAEREQHQQQLIQEKSNQLAPLKSQNDCFEQKLKTLSLERDFRTLSHEQTVLSLYTLKLRYALTELEGKLDPLLHRLDLENWPAQLENYGQDVVQLRLSLTQRSNDSGRSIDELAERVRDNTDALDKSWDALGKTLSPQFNMRHLYSEFEELKNTPFYATYLSLQKKLDDMQNIVAPLKQLATIHQGIQTLLTQVASPESDRLQLEQAIQDLEMRIAAPDTQALSAEGQPGILRQKYETIETLRDTLRQQWEARKRRDLEQELARFNTETETLIRAYEALPKKAAGETRREMKQAFREYLAQPAITNCEETYAGLDARSSLNEKIARLHTFLQDDALPQTQRNQTYTRFFQEDTPETTFNAYLLQRAQTFWLLDMFSAWATTVLSCLGIHYKPEKQKREEYLNDLNEAYKAYQQTPYDEPLEHETNLARVRSKIADGIRWFSPRKTFWGPETDSLQSKLRALQIEIATIEGDTDGSAAPGQR